MTCSLKISTWTGATTSSKQWYSHSIDIEVDGGPSSKWVAYESFVKMTKFHSAGAPTSTGHPMWVEAQGTMEVPSYHSPVVTLVFSGVDYYSGSGIAANITPEGAIAPGKLRRLPFDNVGTTTDRLKVSIFGGINVNT
jgi:hypothetical protein